MKSVNANEGHAIQKTREVVLLLIHSFRVLPVKQKFTISISVFCDSLTKDHTVTYAFEIKEN